MSEKKLYWFKFKDDFFDDIRIKKLRKIAGGDTYTIIYLKLQLLSLKNDGYIFYDGVEDDWVKELALKIDEDIDDVSITISYLLKHEMIIELNPETFVLPETIKCIGNDNSTNRVREFRKRQKELTNECQRNVTETLHETFHETTLENKRIREQENKNSNSLEIKEIVAYLNQKLNTNYRISTPKTQTLINSRIRDGFKVDDFKKVIDKKYDEWHNTDMAKYLTPETLFGNKFEKYLQQKYQPKKTPQWYDEYRNEQKQNTIPEQIVEENIEDLENFFK